MNWIVLGWRWLVQRPSPVLKVAALVLLWDAGYLTYEHFQTAESIIGRLVPFVQRLDARRAKKAEERKEERKIE